MNDKEKIEFLTNALQHIQSLLNWSNPKDWTNAVSESMEIATDSISHVKKDAK